MTQQVVHASFRLPTRVVGGIRPTFTMTFEQLGADTTVSTGSMDSLRDQVMAAVMAAWNGSGAQPPTIGANQDVEVSWYDLTDKLSGTAPLGSPIYVNHFTTTGGGTGIAPDELSMVVSFRSAYPSGSHEVFGPGTHIRARHRGRIYIPISSGALENAPGDGRCQFKNANMSAAVLAFASIKAGTGASNVRPVQWSRRDAAVYQIEEWTIDSEPDTRRRRGNAALGFVAAPPVA